MPRAARAAILGRLAAWLLLLGLAPALGHAQPAVQPREAAVQQPAPEPPSTLFGELYRRAALSGIFEDSKQLADALPLHDPEEILRDYRVVQPLPDARLQQFLDRHFDLSPDGEVSPAPEPGLPISRHIAQLWPLLTRDAPRPPPFSSLLPLPHSYVVPGGRFTEIYYWDSYFTMLGFGPEQAGLARDMVENFAHLIRTYGHIPNGNRTYYLSRSQPPFFFKMVELTAPADPAQALAAYLPELRTEYAYWMSGRRVVRMPDGALLNRYSDDRDAPRDESYREDVALARASGRPDIYRDIRAAAESGWDFSSRWFGDGRTLDTIETTSILPIDLNSLLYGLEKAISEGCRAAGDRACERAFTAKAAARRAAVQTYLWNEETGLFDDYDAPARRLKGNVSAAALYPLFFGLATQSQADRVAAAVEASLLRPGGLVTTNRRTGEQWDAPNGWAPLQWIGVVGLRTYGHDALAETIATRWLRLVAGVYERTGRLLEKYNVAELTPGGGGEYRLQDGFGWTNGVTAALLRYYPQVLVEDPS